jgi:acetyl esterase/lipase
LLTVAACSTSENGASTEPPVPEAQIQPDGDVVANLGVDLGGVTTADVFGPAAGGGDLMPIVVMLHGTAADRSRLHELARHVAAEGALVYVPSWPSIDQAQGYPSDTDEPYRQQSEVVVCALRHIRRTASEHGGDPDDLTVFGHSGGAMVGAQAAMVSEPPWPGIECDPETSHAPQRFIGSAGDYNGYYQLSQIVADLYAPYDPTSIEPTNTDLEVRLIHGLSDGTLGVSESSEFLGHVLSYGLDAELITTDSGHGEMIDPTTPAGEFVADQIVSLVTGEPSAFDLDGENAEMSYDGVCRYEGPMTFEVGRPIDIEFETSDDPLLWFLAFSIVADATVTDDEVLAFEEVPLGEPPEFVDAGGLELIDQPGSETIRLLFLEGDQRWVLACVPFEPPESETPEIPRFAAVLSPME